MAAFKRGPALTHDDAREGMKIIQVDHVNRNGELLTIIKTFERFIRAVAEDGRERKFNYAPKSHAWHWNFVEVELYEALL